MAPPASRRTGHSRKAQYSVFTGYLLAAIGAVAGVVLLGSSLVQPQSAAPLRSLATDAVAPAGEATAAVRGGARDVWAAISGFWQAGRQNAVLREELAVARVKIAEAEAVTFENKRLKTLLGLTRNEAEPVVVARLVGSSAASARRYAYIGAGRKQGIVPGMPVISDTGVIGRILEVGRSSARVMLLTDSESVLPVRRASDNVVAFAEGRGDGLLRIKLINLGLNPLKVGDLMVTSGAGGYYRPGLAVGIVSELTPDGALARLVAEPAGTNFVMVAPIHQPESVTAAQTAPDSALPDDIAAGENPSGHLRGQ